MFTKSNISNEQLEASKAEVLLVEKLPIVINGNEKYASGLTKRTTVDDVKYAMLSVSEPSFQIEHLDDYALFEKWQGNERILDGKIKIYKLIRLWKSLPGDQLSQVKFIIKRRIQQAKLSARDSNVSAETNNKMSKKFAFCTFSPALDKTWNHEKAKRKSSLVKRQLNLAANAQQENTLLSQDSTDSDDYSRDSSSSTDCDRETNNFKASDRYASIKRFNRSRKSTVNQTQQIKKSFIQLVHKQNEIIDRQLNNIQQTRSRSKSLSKFLRSKSLDKCDRSKHNMDMHNLDENDIKQAFTSVQAGSTILDDKQGKEYTLLCKDYSKIQKTLNTKLQSIKELKSELNQYKNSDNEQSNSTKRLNKSIQKTAKKLQSSIDTNNMQSTKINDLNQALNKIEDIITLKEKFIQSLEKELQRLDNSDEIRPEVVYQKKSLAYTSESASSSTSSVLTSVSQQQTNNMYSKSTDKYNMSYVPSGDNESDTGISSANSEDFNSHLETLV